MGSEASLIDNAISTYISFPGSYGVLNQVFPPATHNVNYLPTGDGANSLNPDQTRHLFAGPDLDPKLFDILVVIIPERGFLKC